MWCNEIASSLGELICFILLCFSFVNSKSPKIIFRSNCNYICHREVTSGLIIAVALSYMYIFYDRRIIKIWTRIYLIKIIFFVELVYLIFYLFSFFLVHTQQGSNVFITIGLLVNLLQRVWCLQIKKNVAGYIP